MMSQNLADVKISAYISESFYQEWNLTDWLYLSAEVVQVYSSLLLARRAAMLFMENILIFILTILTKYSDIISHELQH